MVTTGNVNSCTYHASQLSPFFGPGFSILGSAKPIIIHLSAFHLQNSVVFTALSLFPYALKQSFPAVLVGLGGEEVDRKITCVKTYSHCLYPELFSCFLWDHTVYYYLWIGELLGFSMNQFFHQQSHRNDGTYLMLV